MDNIKFFFELVKDSGFREWLEKMIKELKSLFWFLAVILLVYVLVLGVQAVAPDGLVKPAEVESKAMGGG